MNDQSISVEDNPSKNRFDVFDNDDHAGYSMYKDFDPSQTGQRILYHTVIFDDFEGRGLASALTRIALGTSIEEGHRIVAVCPYVKKWLSSHHDYDSSLDQVRPAHLQAIS